MVKVYQEGHIPGSERSKGMKHAVLTDTNGYYAIDTADEHIIEYESGIARLHMLMQSRKIDALWAMPNCHFSNTIRREHFEAMEGKHYHAYVPEHLVHNRVYGALVRYRHELDHGIHDSDRYFMFPGNREWKVPQGKDRGVWNVQTPQELLQTVELLESKYKVPILWNPGHVGWEYFKSLAGSRSEPGDPLDEAQREEFESMGKQIIQPLGYAGLNQDGAYIHGFDKNAQFLGAAQSVELGSGPYSYETEFQPELCGLWGYSLGNEAKYFPGIAGTGIASTDLIVALQLAGYQPMVTEGIVWGTHKRYLNRWAIDMWDNRAYFNDLANLADVYEQACIFTNCASTAKMVPNSMIGVLVRKGYPHWNRLIVHRAMANQLYTIMKVERETSYKPVLVSRDSLYYVSDNANPYHSAFSGLLEYEHEQRGYKLIGTCKLTDEIKHAFTRVHDRRFGVGGIEGVIKREMQDAL